MENQREGKAICDGFGGGAGGAGAGGGGGSDGGLNTNHPPPRPCPRCQSPKTKFCYFNNYSLSQPRYYCKDCRRYWTQGGTLRNVPVGGGCRKSKRSKVDPSTSAAPPTAPPMLSRNYLHHQMQGTTALGGASGSGGGSVGNMLFGVRESTNTVGAFGSTFAPMTQQSPLNVGSNSMFMNGFTLSGYPLNHPQNQLRNQLFQNVYSVTEVGSSSTSAASMGAEWNLSVQAAAPAPPLLFPETNNDNNNNNTNDADDDNDDELSRQWADYMGNSGLGGEP